MSDSRQDKTTDLSVLKRMWPLIWAHRTRLIASLALAIAAALFQVAQLVLVVPTVERLFKGPGAASDVLPATTGITIKDRMLGLVEGWVDYWAAGAQHHHLTALAVLAVLLVLTTAGKGLAIYGQRYLVTYCANRVVQTLREMLFRRIMGASMRFFGRQRMGELLTGLGQDIELLRSLTLVSLGDLIRIPFTIVAIVTWLFMLHSVMALSSFVALSGSVLVITWFGHRIKRARRSVQDHLATQTSVEQEAFANIRVVKAYGMEAYEQAKFTDTNQRMFDRLMKITQARAAVAPVMEFLGALGGAVILLLGGYVVLVRGEMSGADFFAFLLALMALYQPCKRLAHDYNTVQQALVGGARVFDLFDRAEPLPDTPGARALPPFADCIRFEKISFAYELDRPVLHDIELEVKRGEVVALVGPSGAGKSTLMDLLLRFHDPNQGRVTVDGHDLRELRQDGWLEQVGVVPQEVLLFNDTVRANIAYGRNDVSPEQLRDAARRAQALEFIEDLPQGFDTPLGERGTRLSGGQRQRLAIARALIKSPAVLIFDEATSSLDTESENLVREATKALFTDRTVFIIAHRLSTIRDADRIVVLDQGRIVDIGPHDALMQRCPLYQRLHALQTRAPATP